MADGNGGMVLLQVIKNKTIASSGVFTSDPINLQEIRVEGSLSLQVEVTGDGTAKFEFSQSNTYNPHDGTGDFVKPVSGFGILTGIDDSAGTGSDGKDTGNINAFVSKAMKIICTETGTSNAVVVNAWLCMQ